MKTELSRLTLACLFACSPSMLAADLTPTSFSSPVLLSFGQSPLVSQAADLDLDGRVDLIVGHANGVTLLRNQNSGTLAPGSFPGAIMLPVSGSVFGVAAGDLNGDGKPDLAVTQSGGVVLFENRSTSGVLDASSFAAGVQLSLHGSSSTGDLLLADFNADGKLDLAVVDHDGSQVLVLRNLSTGGALAGSTFDAPLSLFTSVGPNNLVAVDLDLAGGLDLAVVADGGLSVFRNSSSGGSIDFQPVSLFVGAAGPMGIAAGDLDGDSKPELIIPSYFNFGISVLHNNSSPGNIVFLSQTDLSTGDFPRSVAATDLNRDGRIDLAIAHELGGAITLLQNNHLSGGFSGASLAATDLFPGAEPYQLITSDLNQDGKLDLVVSFLQAGSVGLLQNNLDLPVIPPATNPPPVVTNPPPVIETNTPPVVTNPPPVIETNSPPVVTNPPPVIETNTPPVVTNPPPVIETNAPPVNRAPIANAGADLSVEAVKRLTRITLDGSLSSDPDGDALTYAWSKSGLAIGTGRTLSLSLPVGRHEFVLRVSDLSGAASEDTVVVEIRDTVAPEVLRLTATPNRLSPNHKMVKVEIRVRSTDDVDPNPQSKIVSVRSNEPANGRGDGHTSQDWQITGDLTLKLRAERSGKGLGRIYTITVATTDDSGNTTLSDVLVRVPKNNRQ